MKRRTSHIEASFNQDHAKSPKSHAENEKSEVSFLKTMVLTLTITPTLTLTLTITITLTLIRGLLPPDHGGGIEA